MKETIGTGGFAKVKLARHKVTEEKVILPSLAILFIESKMDALCVSPITGGD